MCCSRTATSVGCPALDGVDHRLVVAVLGVEVVRDRREGVPAVAVRLGRGVGPVGLHQVDVEEPPVDPAGGQCVVEQIERPGARLGRRGVAERRGQRVVVVPDGVPPPFGEHRVGGHQRRVEAGLAEPAREEVEPGWEIFVGLVDLEVEPRHVAPVDRVAAAHRAGRRVVGPVRAAGVIGEDHALVDDPVEERHLPDPAEPGQRVPPEGVDRHHHQVPRDGSPELQR